MLRPILLLAVGLLLSACASDRLDPGKISQFRKVAVISAIGDKLTLTEVAMTAFGNDEDDGDINNWGIDQHVVEKLSGLLKARYDVVPLRYQLSDFTDDKVVATFGSGLNHWAPLGVALRHHITGQAGAGDIDAYIVVVKETSSIDLTNQYTEGLGVVRRFAIPTRRFFVHALYDIIIVDGHNFQPLRSILARDAVPDPLSGRHALYGIFKEVDDSYWADSFVALSAPQRDKIHQESIRQIDDSLPGYLTRGGLLP